MKLGEGDKNNLLNGNLLVLSIDHTGKILFFNKELERQIGFYRDEIVDKKTLDLLIPNYYKKNWLNILEEAKNENILTDYRMPLVSKKGKEIMAKWDIAPVDDKNLGSIGFVGKPIKDKSYELTKSDNSDKMSFNIGNKKIFFKKPTFLSKNKKNEKKKSSVNSKSADKKPFFTKYDPQKLKDNVKVIDKKIGYLEYLEKENIELKEKLKDTELELSKIRKKLELLEKKRKISFNKSQSIFHNTLDSFFDLIGGKKKKEEFNRMMNTLNKRREEIEEFEKSLDKDKNEINNSVTDFVEWRKKLENLENEVEKRREFLVEREQNVKDNLLTYVDEGVNKNISSKEENSFKETPSELIDNLDTAAVILQRGILKHANSHFVEIIGSSADKILEKSFFDFISSEGLPSFEKYYLDRLKGETSDFYNTVFLTADDTELPVKVDIKPVLYNGSIVDKLVVVKKSEDTLDDQSNQVFESDESVGEDKETKIEENSINEDNISDDEIESEDENSLNKNELIVEKKEEKVDKEE